MTLVTTHALYCEGKEGDCDASWVMIDTSPQKLRAAAREAGWQADQNTEPDLCPECLNPPDNTCPLCHEDPYVEYREAMGHDTVGHRLANLLARNDVTTWAALLALTAPTIRKMRGLGETGKGRICWVQNMAKRRHP